MSSNKVANLLSRSRVQLVLALLFSVGLLSTLASIFLAPSFTICLFAVTAVLYLLLVSHGLLRD